MLATVLSLLVALAQSVPVIGQLADLFVETWGKLREAEAAARLEQKKKRNADALRPDPPDAGTAD